MQSRFVAMILVKRRSIDWMKLRRYSSDLRPSQLYEIVESKGRGKAVIAVADMLPGTLVMEDLPLFEYHSSLDLSGGNPLSGMKDMYHSFRAEVSPVNQTRLFKLYSPIDGPQEESMQSILRSEMTMSKEDAAKAVKLFTICRLNGFDGVVYDHISRLAHSCAPNCIVGVVGRVGRITTVRSVTAGEELTLSYLGEEEGLLPTHERRWSLLAHKDFTCHCPRCDALGDDTRQFECKHAGCGGFLMMRHPLGKDSIPPHLKYTGVEYVEPHLLPCTVCQRSPTPEYQEMCFQIEERQKVVGRMIKDEVEKMGAVQRFDSRVVELTKAQFPVRHSGSLPVLEAAVAVRLMQAGPNGNPQPAEKAANQVVNLYEGVLQAPSAKAERMHALLGSSLAPCLSRKALKIAKTHLQSALRINALHCGREMISEVRWSYDRLLAGVLEKLEPAAAAAAASAGKNTRTASSKAAALNGDDECKHCAFCGESPARAAMVVRYCPSCSQAMYCSAACQKAHWAVHRAHCKQ